MTALSPLARLLLAWLCLALVGLCSPALAGGPGRALVIRNPATGLKAELPLAGVSRVSIRFFHSFDRHWVTETFRVADGRLVPSAVTYADDSYDYRDTRYRCRSRVGDESVQLDDIRPAEADKLAVIRARVAHIHSQRLILAGAHGDSQYLFTQWGRPGQPLVLSVK